MKNKNVYQDIVSYKGEVVSVSIEALEVPNTYYVQLKSHCPSHDTLTNFYTDKYTLRKLLENIENLLDNS